MRAELVAVGTELLIGQIANTNAQWISERLAELGIDVLHEQVVGDNADRIVASIRLAASRSDVVVVTGGLGPTQDDVTRPAVAEAAGATLVRHPEIEQELRERFRVRGRAMPESNLAQADVPEPGRYIRPERGTAPGLIVSIGEAIVYAVPGVPSEMREMMEGTVLRELAGRAGPSALVSRTLRCYGLAESRISELLDDLFHASANPSVAYLAGGGEVHVRLTAKARTREEAASMLGPLEERVRERLGDHVYGTDDEPMEAVVGRLLADRGTTLACAESLTGGGLGERITAVPGA
ncbi:MAG TPA: CinA family nicotinamide mononucleotide deamidase-related protein, partial [Actinomycetota bacterium]|nr:CinA family nicotinamide mononucleotide deamidase-related protein [Actinomycetota bacterium]